MLVKTGLGENSRSRRNNKLINTDLISVLESTSREIMIGVKVYTNTHTHTLIVINYTYCFI